MNLAAAQHGCILRWLSLRKVVVGLNAGANGRYLPRCCPCLTIWPTAAVADEPSVALDMRQFIVHAISSSRRNGFF